MVFWTISYRSSPCVWDVLKLSANCSSAVEMQITSCLQIEALQHLIGLALAYALSWPVGFLITVTDFASSSVPPLVTYCILWHEGSGSLGSSSAQPVPKLSFTLFLLRIFWHAYRLLEKFWFPCGDLCCEHEHRKAPYNATVRFTTAEYGPSFSLVTKVEQALHWIMLLDWRLLISQHFIQFKYLLWL